mmetsp:Transcript_5703/g.7485  ORF Transcript_5703/g.7485 Transcript_5703/m.7485 type:complete len:206 (+) Transcript_5703:74-691(+)
MHVSLVIRHGARAPGKAAFKKFEGTESTKSWGIDELELLTEAGKEGSRSVGKAFAWNPAYKPVTSMRAVWKSSPISRAKKSGKCFLQGLEMASQEHNMCTLWITKELEKEHENEESMDMMFRPWIHNEYYLKQNSEIKAGESFKVKAESEKDFLLRLRKLLPSMSTQPIAKVLSNTTYIVEMLECEKYDLRNRRYVVIQNHSRST